jgi:protein-disulfide isomerase
MDLHKKTSQKDLASSGGNLLIAAAILLAGVTIAAAVIVKDSVALPFGGGSSKETEVLGSGVEGTEGGEGEDARFDISSEGGVGMGEDSAPVTIVEISDFTCPFCAAVYGFREDVVNSLKSRNPDWIPAIPEIEEKYIKSGQVQHFFKVIPGHGEVALDAGRASLCANDQGKFWEYHDKLFETQADWYTAEEEGEAEKSFKAFAGELNLDTTKFDKCFDDGDYSSEIMKNYSDSQEIFDKMKEAGLVREDQMGLGTPSFFINGRYLPGAQGFEAFEKIIEEELARVQ